MPDQPTQDPGVVIEDRRPGYTRYRNTVTGRRWEVHGECVKLGYCILGAVVNGEYIETLDRAIEIANTVDFLLDSPVTPEFEGCCPFTYVELPPAAA